MRLFVAIELPDAWREEARRIGEHLVAALGDDARLRFTATERLHLTLRFLGDVDEAVLPDLRDQLAQEVASVRVPLELAGVGQFGGRSRPTVLWFGLAGDLDRLASLHDAVERAVVAAGRRSRPAAASACDLRPRRAAGHVEPATRDQRRGRRDRDAGERSIRGARGRAGAIAPRAERPVRGAGSVPPAVALGRV